MTIRVFRPDTLYKINPVAALDLVALTPEQNAAHALLSLDEYIAEEVGLKKSLSERYCYARSSSNPVVQGCGIAPCTIQDIEGNPAPYNGTLGCMAAMEGHYSPYTDLGINELVEVNA